MTESSPTPSVIINTVPQPATALPQGMAVYSNPGSAGGLQQRHTVDIGVTNQQIALIATTEIEKKIRNRIGEYRKALEELRKEETSLVNSLNAILESWCREQVSADSTNINALAAALRPFTGRDLTTSYGVASYNPRTRRLTATATFASGDFSLSHSYTAEASTSFIASTDQITLLSRQIKEEEERIRQAKLTLSNMDAVARQAEASIAQSTLNQTAEGKAMAEAIQNAASEGNVDDLIRRLQI